MPEPIVFPKTMLMALALANKVLNGTGIESNTVNADHKVHKGLYDWQRLTGLRGPPRDVEELHKLQLRITSYDHDAQCSCNDKLVTHGHACHVVCPTQGQQVCTGRGTPTGRLDPWDGAQVWA